MSIALWRSVLLENFTDIGALVEYLQLPPSLCCKLAGRRPFGLNLPRRLAAKMAKGTLDDPLLRQFVPLHEEELRQAGFCPQPLAEEQFRPTPKLLHKYCGRVLLLCTSSCAMHCRYCFRQNFPYETQQKGFHDELAYIAQDATIREVILSGGDPLSLSDRVLNALFDGLKALPHVKRIRFHTRFPIGIPERVDASLCAMLAALPQKVYLILHANHPREFDSDVLASIDLLQRHNVSTLHQAVLLKGVNDDIETLVELYELLVDHGVLPYYLYQLDRVAGSHHFEVTAEEGLRLHRALVERLSGYAVPKYVQEIPGMPAKQPVLQVL